MTLDGAITRCSADNGDRKSCGDRKETRAHVPAVCAFVLWETDTMSFRRSSPGAVLSY